MITPSEGDKSDNKASLTHAGLARRYRWPIAGTFALLGLENLYTVAEPWLLGRAIDGIASGGLAELVLYLVAGGAAMFLGMGRRFYDTRVYGRIYRESAGDVADSEFAQEASTARTAARVAFVQEFVDFFEHMLPAALVSVFMLVGSIVMMAVISPMVCIATVAVVALIAAIFGLSARRIGFLNAMLNDEAERQVDILTARDGTLARTHFLSLVQWRIRLSDLEARNFGGVFLLTLALTGFAAWILVGIEQKSVGETFAALSYVLQFSQSVIILPYTYQQFLRTSEISERLGKNDQAGSPPA